MGGRGGDRRVRVPDKLDGEPFEAFVGGLGDRPVLTESVGAAGGVQVDFSPLGARRCLGAWTFRRLAAADGRLAVGALAAEVG